MQHLYCWLRELQVVQRSPKRLDLLRRAERCAGENSLQLEGGGLSFLRLFSSPCIFSSLFHCRVLCSLILPVRLRNRAGAREELLGSPGSDPALESTTTATTAPRLNVSDLHRMLTDAYGLRGAWRLACFLSKDPLAWKKAIGACAFADGGEVNTGGWSANVESARNASQVASASGTCRPRNAMKLAARSNAAPRTRWRSSQVALASFTPPSMPLVLS